MSDRCPHCGLAYRRNPGEQEWCRVCPEGAAKQDAETQRLWRYANEEFDRAEAVHLEQRGGFGG